MDLTLHQAVRYATDTWHVNIISLSFGIEEYSPKIHDAITYAYSKNVVILAAASNYGANPLLPIAYPARQLGIVLCINAADFWGNKAACNPPAATHRDNFSILGESVNSIWPKEIQGGSPVENGDEATGYWRRLSGTSVATPIAAAVAASLMQFRTLHPFRGSKVLESFNGIRQLFARMTPDKDFKESGGFDFIRPWAILDYDWSKSGDRISNIISEELKKI